MKVVYELRTENDKKFDVEITEEEIKELMDWCTETMNNALNGYLNIDHGKVIVTCQSITEYKDETKGWFDEVKNDR